jgi:hypothetical protein
MRRAIWKISLIVFPIGMLIILSNYIIDPANLFSSKQYVSGIASILSNGHNVDGVANYDERLLQEQMVIRLKKSPDVIVFGSSRVMEIGSDFFPSKSVLNIAVSHANIHDLVALTGLLDSLKRLPQLLLINVDPSLVSHFGTSEWQSLSGYHDYFSRKLQLEVNLNFPKSNKARRLLSLMSLEYFKQSLAFMFKGASKEYADVGTQPPRTYGRFSDGTVCYSYNYTHPDSMKVATDARKTAIKEGVPSPDSGNVRILKRVINYLRTNGTDVKLVMLPFHHDYYLSVNKNQSDLFYTYDAMFRDLAARNGIGVIGGFNGFDFNISRSQFYDMYHCSKEAIKKVILN